MVCNIIETDDPGLASMMSETHSFNNEALGYLEKAHSNFMSTATNMVDSFKNTINHTFNYFNNNVNINRVMSDLIRVDGLVGDNQVYRIHDGTKSDIGYTMRSYVMAEPEIYRLDKLYRVGGFEGKWFDNESNVKNPYLRDDYLNVVDEVLLHSTDENGDEFSYFNTVSSSEVDKLTVDERLAVIDSWDYVKYMLANGEDITDV